MTWPVPASSRILLALACAACSGRPAESPPSATPPAQGIPVEELPPEWRPPATQVPATAAPLTTAQPPAAIEGKARGATFPCVTASAEVREPYRWYPALDLARVPFHAGSGEWGPRAPIAAPLPPRTERTLSVSTAEELANALRKPHTEVHVTRSIDQDVVVMGDVIDVDLVVPPGVALRSVAFGSYHPPSQTQRLRIRGTTPMRHSGGRLGFLRFYSVKTSDVIIDGVDLNGDEGHGGDGLWAFDRGGERIAVVNVRGHGVGWGSLQSHTSDIVIAGCSIVTGARSRAVNGFPEAWGIRGGDRMIVFRNYLEGSRYHRVRVHPEPGPPQYAWLAENVFVDRHEGRIASATNVEATVPGTRYAGFWAHCNAVYGYTSCMMVGFDAPSASYADLTHNVFYGSFTRETQTLLQQQHGPHHDYLSDNRFETWQEPPPPFIDAKAIPLPVDDPTDDKPSLEPKTPCPGPQ